MGQKGEDKGNMEGRMAEGGGGKGED